MKLFDDQILVAEQFDEWLNNTMEQTAGLFASAGFGKSFMSKYMIDEVIIKNSNYTLYARTLQATTSIHHAP